MSSPASGHPRGRFSIPGVRPHWLRGPSPLVERLCQDAFCQHLCVSALLVCMCVCECVCQLSLCVWVSCQMRAKGELDDEGFIHHSAGSAGSCEPPPLI